MVGLYRPRVSESVSIAYLGIKYHPDNRNRSLVEAITSALAAEGIATHVVARDVERWGEVSLSPEALMAGAFEAIDGSDLVVIELSEKGVGLGIEAGYAFAKSIPVVVVHSAGTDVSATLAGIADVVFEYRDESELPSIAREISRLRSSD